MLDNRFFFLMEDDIYYSAQTNARELQFKHLEAQYRKVTVLISYVIIHSWSGRDIHSTKSFIVDLLNTGQQGGQYQKMT